MKKFEEYVKLKEDFFGGQTASDSSPEKPQDVELEHLAQWVVTLYDQANTNNAVRNLGDRARYLNRAIEDLRKGLQQRNTPPAQGNWK